MRERILWWLFGTTDIDSYMELLRKRQDHLNENLKLLDEHGKTIDRATWAINTIEKLMKICEKHGINVDEEIKLIEMEGNENE